MVVHKLDFDKKYNNKFVFMMDGVSCNKVLDTLNMLDIIENQRTRTIGRKKHSNTTNVKH